MGKIILAFVRNSARQFSCAVSIFKAEKEYWMRFKELILENEIGPYAFTPRVQYFPWKLL